MAAVMMPGGPVAEAVYAEVGERVQALLAAGTTVGLGTILVGDDPASQGYIAKKHEMCERYGLISFHQQIPADGSQDDLLAAVARFNADPAVDAFLLQNPVPRGFDFNAAVLAIDPAKDADGLHPVNLGLMALGAPGPRPPTPSGVQALLAHYDVPVAGPQRGHRRAGPDARAPVVAAAQLEGARRQRRRDAGPHRRQGLAGVHPAGRHRRGGGRNCRA